MKQRSQPQRLRRTTAGVGFSLTAALALVACGPSPGGGNGDESGFAGEDLQIIVPFSEGGGTDTISRLVGPYLTENLEGAPSVQVRNVVGGGGMAGTNQFAREANPDGTGLLMTADSNHFPYILGDPAVEYDLAEFEPIIGFPGGAVIYVSPDTGVSGIEDLPGASGLVYGGIGATATDLTTLVGFELLDLDVSAVLGYEGRSAARVAFEQGETTIDMQFTFAYPSTVEPMVEAGEAIPLFTMGIVEEGQLVRDPAHPDLPTIAEAYEEINGEAPSGEAWDAYLVLAAAGYSVQKVLWAHGESPEGRVETLRAAAEVIAEDEEFNEAGAEVLSGYDPLVGAALTDEIGAMLEAPDSVRQWLRDFLVTEYGVERLADG